jgi:hypothetical protein
LKLKHDKLLSSFAFNCNLRRYTKDATKSKGGPVFAALRAEAGAYTRPRFSSTYALFVGDVGGFSSV